MHYHLYLDFIHNSYKNQLKKVLYSSNEFLKISKYKKDHSDEIICQNIKKEEKDEYDKYNNEFFSSETHLAKGLLNENYTYENTQVMKNIKLIHGIIYGSFPNYYNFVLDKNTSNKSSNKFPIEFYPKR